MEEIKIKVKGMMCEGCEKRVKNALTTINEIEEVEANHETGIVNIKLSSQIDKAVIEKKIKDIGFEVEE